MGDIGNVRFLCLRTLSNCSERIALKEESYSLLSPHTCSTHFKVTEKLGVLKQICFSQFINMEVKKIVLWPIDVQKKLGVTTHYSRIILKSSNLEKIATT